MYTHAHSHTQVDTQSHRDTHTPLTHILILTCSFTDTHVFSHTHFFTPSRSHTPHTRTPLLGPPSPSCTHLHPHFPVHSHSGCKGPSSHLCPAHLPTRWLWDRELIPAGSRRHVARCAGCSPVCLWLPLVTVTRPHTEPRQAIKSRLWGLSGASLVTSGRWLSFPPCPSHIMCHLHSQAPSGEKGEMFLLGEECGVWTPWPPN